MPGSPPVKKPRATSKYSLITTLAGGPSVIASSAPAARSTARSTGSSRSSFHSSGSASDSIRSIVSCWRTAPRTIRANNGTSASGIRPFSNPPSPPGSSPNRWRTNWSITVSALSDPCSLWNSACTAAMRDAVRVRAFGGRLTLRRGVGPR